MFNLRGHKAGARLPRPCGLVLFLSFIFIYNFALAALDSREAEMDMLLAQAVPSEPPVKPQIREDLRQQLGSEIPEEPPEEEAMAIEFSNAARFLPKSGANAMEGGVSFVENDAEVSYEYKIMENIPLEIYFGSSYTGINNSTPVNLPAKLTSIGMGLNITLPFFFDKSYLYFSVEPAFNSDNWVIKGSTFRSPFTTLFIYQPDNKLTMGAGVTVSPHYKFRNLVAPVYGFIYKPDDKWTFNILSDNPEVSYQFNQKLSLLFEIGFTNEEYVVKKDNIKEIIIRNFDNRYGFGAVYKINKNIEASLSAGWVVDRTLKYRDDLGKVAIEPGMYSQFRMDISI